MKDYILLLLCVICLSCSEKDREPQPNTDRPGTESQDKQRARICFEPPAARIITGTHAAGSLDITLRREGSSLPDTLYNIKADGVTAPRTVHFARGITEAQLPVHYNLHLSPGEELLCTVSADSAVFSLYISNSPDWRTECSGIWDDGSTLRHAVLLTRETSLTREACVTAGADTLATFILTPGHPDAAAYEEDMGVAAWHGCHFIAGREGRSVLEAKYTDGWIFGVISFEAAPPKNPELYPWRCLLVRDGNDYTAVDLYASAPLLSELNTVVAPALLRLHTDGTAATVPPQPAPFVNTDLFPSGLVISGDGKFEDGIIKIPVPLTDFHGTMSPWAKVYESRWEFTQNQ